MDKTEAICRLAASRRTLLEAIASFSDDEICTIHVEGTWTIKDLLGHIASWERAFLEPLGVFIAGGGFKPEDIPDHLAWNEIQSRRWPALTLAEITAEYHQVRQQLLDTLDKLSDDQWHEIHPAPWGGNETIVQMVSGLAWHEGIEHMRKITALHEEKG